MLSHSLSPWFGMKYIGISLYHAEEGRILRMERHKYKEHESLESP